MFMGCDMESFVKSFVNPSVNNHGLDFDYPSLDRLDRLDSQFGHLPTDEVGRRIIAVQRLKVRTSGAKVGQFGRI